MFNTEFVSIATAIAALITAIVGIWQNVLTRKSLEEANRPYINIYKDTLYVTDLVEYIVIKNSGNTPAKIEEITFDETKIQSMSLYTSDKKILNANLAINGLNHSTLAPKQVYRIPITNAKTQFNDIQFYLVYKGSRRFKKYKEKIRVNLKQDMEIPYPKSDDEKAVGDVLQEILRRL